jgi:hypothetical protein
MIGLVKKDVLHNNLGGTARPEAYSEFVKSTYINFFLKKKKRVVAKNAFHLVFLDTRFIAYHWKHTLAKRRTPRSFQYSPSHGDKP